MGRIIYFFFLLLLFNPAFAQTTTKDSNTNVVLPDSLNNRRFDSSISAVKPAIVPDTLKAEKDSLQLSPAEINVRILKKHPYLGYGISLKEIAKSRPYQVNGKEHIFYALAAFLLIFALLRQLFPKYVSDLFRLLFRNTVKHRQLNDQQQQTLVPSFLWNAFFCLSGGIYATVLLVFYKRIDQSLVWTYMLYCGLGLAAIYFIKFLGLKIMGFIFSFKVAAESYIFIVFGINKILSILLLPISIILYLIPEWGLAEAIVISQICIGVIYVYRFILTIRTIRNHFNYNSFHFLLYFAAFEICPLLLIYRVLLNYFE